MTQSPPSLHLPVLLHEAVSHLNIQPQGIYVDATFGGGGHARALLSQLSPVGQLITVDRNPAVEPIAAALSIEAEQNNWGALHFQQANFSSLAAVISSLGLDHVDGVLFDLGLSSDLLASGRGFSFKDDAELDMRFDMAAELTAKDIVNTFDQEVLADIFMQFGQEPKSQAIAAAIVRRREYAPFHTAKDLGQCIAETVYQGTRGHLHPATRVFQALRIVVNGEFRSLQEALTSAVQLLSPGGALAAISFHSLEDRFVKRFMKKSAGMCVCFRPPDLCECPRQKLLEIVTTKPVVPSFTEIKTNRRARSAKMRVARKI